MSAQFDTSSHRQPAPSRQDWKRLRRLLWGGLFVLLLLLIGGTGLWVGLDGAEHVNATLATAKPFLLMWRMTLYAGLLVFWPHVAAWLGRRGQLDAETCRRLLGLRWRLTALIVAGELLLAQKLLVRLLNFIH